MNLSQVFPWIGETEVALEYAGFTSAEITRLQADKRRLGAGSVLEQLVAGETPTSDVSSGEAPASTQSSELAEAQVLKARADALGILRRAGVDEHDAAARVGLDGLKFIPGNPITIRERE